MVPLCIVKLLTLRKGCRGEVRFSEMDKRGDRKSADFGAGIFQRFVCRQGNDNASSDKMDTPSDNPRRSLDSTLELTRERMTTTSGGNRDVFMPSGDFVTDHSSILSLQPMVFMKGNDRRGEEHSCEYSDRHNQGTQNSLDNAHLDSPMSISLGFGHRRGLIRSRRGFRHPLKGHSSMDCLIPQLYDESFHFEENLLNSFPSTSAVRPLVITDGNRIISRSSLEPSASVHLSSVIEEEADGVSLAESSGFSPLPKLRTPKRKSRVVTPNGKISSSIPQKSGKTSSSKDISDRLHTLSLGVTIGVISTILSNRREVEKLSDKLRSKENLVRDLQEELEMKESLTVKELANDSCGSKKQNFGNVQSEENKESPQNGLSVRYIPPEQTDDHGSSTFPLVDMMSEMEEELKAELERLDINMNASVLDGEMSALEELDQDVLVDFAQGELRADMLPVGSNMSNANIYSEDISTSPDHFCNPNYAVSPRELSLRLHQVIQRSLEERVEELEQALQQSQKKLKAEQNLRPRVFSGSDIGSSSNQESPTGLSADVASAKPFCLNLTGDSLNAYDKAYEEFTGMYNVEKLPSNQISSKFGDTKHSSDQNLSIEGNTFSELKLEALPSSRLFDFQEYQVISDGEFDEDTDRIDDDECKMLIEQILEKTRQGSPAVLFAQRMLFSVDE